MQKEQTTITKILSNVASAMIDRDTWEWPPQCTIFSYQPARPQRKENTENDIQEISG